MAIAKLLNAASGPSTRPITEAAHGVIAASKHDRRDPESDSGDEADNERKRQAMI
jgi:hypothetical protein